MPGFIGFPEIILLGLLCLILFGPKRLPEMGRGLGKGMREFKDSISGDSHTVDVAKLDAPLEVHEVHEARVEDVHEVV
jgi:sec-independent protein translocase protein TatA